MSMKQAVCTCRLSGVSTAEAGHPDQRHLSRAHQTPPAVANKETWLAFGADYRGEVGIETSTPLEQAYPLVFLCRDAASGITMITDAGYMSSGITGSFPDATLIAKFLMGRDIS
jgi:hypothetical protein